jgi:general secretion pathway protein L
MHTLSLHVVNLKTGPVAVVPASALSWHRISIPKGVSRGRLRAVLEGILEDLVLDDVSDLHFALQPDAMSGTQIWVAVCNRSWLKEAVKTLRKGHVNVRRLVPEFAPGVTNEPAITTPVCWVTGIEELARVTWVDDQGVHQWPLSSGVLDLMPEERTLLAEPSIARLAEQFFQEVPAVVTQQQRLDDAAASEWDLAQFELQPGNAWLESLKVKGLTLWTSPQWRPARWTALALVAAQLVGLNAYALHTSKELSLQREAVNAVVTSTFPGIAVVVDAQIQMERALNLLKSSKGGSKPQDLESMLQAYALLNRPEHDRAMTTIEYSLGDLRLNHSSPVAASKLAADQSLADTPYRTTIEGSTVRIQMRKQP